MQKTEDLRVYTFDGGHYAVAVPTISDNIIKLRNEAGFKGHGGQKRFALAIGVRPQQLNDWENQRYREMSAANLMVIARTLGQLIKRPVSVDELLAGVDPQYDTQLQLRRQAEDHERIEGRTQSDLKESELKGSVAAHRDERGERNLVHTTIDIDQLKDEIYFDIGSAIASARTRKFAPGPDHQVQESRATKSKSGRRRTGHR